MPEKLISHTNKNSDFATWWARRQQEATMQVSLANFEEIRPWEIKNDKIVNLDAETHKSRFFEVVAKMVETSGREVRRFGQPGIVEIEDPSDPDGACGTVALLIDKTTGDILVTAAAEPHQAKAGSEPGEFLSLRASVQGSFSNFEENEVPLSEQIDPKKYNHFVHANPGRIEGKIRVGYTLVNKDEIDLSKQPNSAWFSLEEVDKAIKDNFPFNALFHSALNFYRIETLPSVVEKNKIEESPPIVKESPLPSMETTPVETQIETHKKAEKPKLRHRIKQFFRRLLHP